MWSKIQRSEIQRAENKKPKKLFSFLFRSTIVKFIEKQKTLPFKHRNRERTEERKEKKNKKKNQKTKRKLNKIGKRGKEFFFCPSLFHSLPFPLFFFLPSFFYVLLLFFFLFTFLRSTIVKFIEKQKTLPFKHRNRGFPFPETDAFMKYKVPEINERKIQRPFSPGRVG